MLRIVFILGTCRPTELDTTIFKLEQVHYSLKSKRSRHFFNYANTQFQFMPFNLRYNNSLKSRLHLSIDYHSFANNCSIFEQPKWPRMMFSRFLHKQESILSDNASEIICERMRKIVEAIRNVQKLNYHLKSDFGSF